MSDLAVKDNDSFIAEYEVMDLSGLKDKQFIVAVGAGKRESAKLMPSTMHGPYDFFTMCEEVGAIWTNDLHHAKAFIISKDRREPPQLLDANTIDYIEAHFENIIMEGILGGAFEEPKAFTCEANVITANPEDDKK